MASARIVAGSDSYTACDNISISLEVSSITMGATVDDSTTYTWEILDSNDDVVTTGSEDLTSIDLSVADLPDG